MLKSLRTGQQDIMYIQRSIASAISYELGYEHQQIKQLDQAVSFFKEALQNDENNEQALITLAEISLSKHDFDNCVTYCQTLLKVNAQNEKASMVMADALFQNNKHEEAIEEFQQLLKKNVNNSNILVQLVLLLRNAGRMPDTLDFVNHFEKSAPRLDPGFYFAKGLYHSFTNNPREALTNLNLARKSSEWGDTAVMRIVQIYLHADTATAIDSKGDKTDAFNAADNLLKQIVKPEMELIKQVLQAEILIAKNGKGDIEKALAILAQIISKDNAHVPAIVVMAQAFLIQKQTSKARNNLKRMNKAEHVVERSEWQEYYERGWLMLANLYIEANKADVAQNLLRVTLQVNKSCYKAWELMGLVFEKEQSFGEASDCYENAWKLTYEKDPSIGFKLAFNLLKAKKWIPSINICNKVLAEHKKYPKIKEEVLDVARSKLRPTFIREKKQ